MARVAMRSLNKKYDEVHAVIDVNLDIRDQEFVVLVGPSGCGKTTTLRMVAGLESITSGHISIDEKVVNELPPMDRDIAMVFQNYALYPHMSVYDNMAFGLKMRKFDKAEIAKRVQAAADILGIEQLLKRKPRQLSGGQRQRVALGRAIVRHPQVFLFDEPLSNLDAELRVHMRIEIARLHRELATTIIYVTHDQVEAMTLADKIVVLREGEVAQVGTPLQLYDDPDNMFVAGFIGSPKMNFVRGVVADGGIQLPDYEGQSIPLASGLAAGSEVTVGIRPEHFATGGPARLDLVVEMIEHLGAETYAYARAGEGALLTIATHADRSLEAGSPLAAS